MSVPGQIDACAGECADTKLFDFQMAFQPLVDIAARRIYGYEALVRGPKGEGAGWVLSQITDANRYAFDQGCRVKAISTAAALGLDRRLSINFLPNAVYNPQACLKLTLSAANEHQFPLDLITFEFTEDEKIIDRNHLNGIITAYRQQGFKTALDDFGAGFAGLSLLADLQPDTLKIDRTLITNIDSDLPRQAIVSGIVHMARLLKLDVLAEGVERGEEIAFLRGIGITLFQGFYFAKPAIGRLISDDQIPWV